MRKLIITLSICIAAGTLVQSAGYRNLNVESTVTADVLTLLLGNLNDVQINYLIDAGTQLNKLVTLLQWENCENYIIRDTMRARIKDLQNLAQCLIRSAKQSKGELPVRVNSILQTIVDLLDPTSLNVRFIATTLNQDFENKCAELVPEFESFLKPCLQNNTMQECIKMVRSDEKLNSATYCIL